MRAVYKYLMSFLFLFVFALSVLLVYEYCFFRAKLSEVIAIKNEYSEYLCKVKNFLEDHSKNVKNDSSGGNGNVSFVFDEQSFPEGVRIYSSDDSDDQECDPFVIVNRESDYLQSAAQSYIGEHLGQLEKALNAKRRSPAKKQKKKQETVVKKQSKQKKENIPWTIKRFAGLLKKSRIRKKDIDFSMPIDPDKFWISSLYGRRKKRNGKWGFHFGIDMASMKGTPVKAVADGTVIEASYFPGYGKTVVVAHSKKYKTRYAHLSRIKTKAKSTVKKNQIIGLVGDTGLVRKSGNDASHLHFEVCAFGKHVNPLYLLL